MDTPDFSGFVSEFLEEAEEHLQTLNSLLLQMEKANFPGAIKTEKADSLLRAAHTVKGLAGMMEFERIETLCHKMEDIFGEMRAGRMPLEGLDIDPLLAAVDALSLLIANVRSSNTDKGIDITQACDGLEAMMGIRQAGAAPKAAPKTGGRGEIPTAREAPEMPAPGNAAVFDPYSLPVSDKERAVLAEAASTGLWIYEVSKEFVGGTPLEKLERLPIFKEVENGGMLIGIIPALEEVPESQGTVNCRILFSSDLPYEDVRENFMDPVRVVLQGTSPAAVPTASALKEVPLDSRGLAEVFRTLDPSLIAEFVRSAGINTDEATLMLAELERDPANMTISAGVLSVFRALKSKAAVFGFNKLAVLAGRLELLFENIKAERITPGPDLLETITKSMTRLKGFLDEIRRMRDTGITADAEISAINLALGKARRPAAEVDEVLKNSWLGEDIIRWLRDEEKNILVDEVRKSVPIYDVVITFRGDVIRSGFEPLSIVPILERAGNILVSIPMIENVPSLATFEAGQFGIGFRFLLSSRLSTNEILNRLGQMPKFMNVSVTEAVRRASPAGAKERIQLALPASAAVEKGPSQPASDAERKMKEKASNTIRVDIERLDKLLNLIGELVIDRTRLEQIGTELRSKLPNDPLTMRLAHTNQLFQRHMADIQETVMSVRMVPIAATFGKFPRVVRDLAKSLGKTVTLTMRGEETELDKTLIEEIADPLVHLIRNAVDHGIETPDERRAAGKPDAGTLELRAYHEGDTIIIDVSDDGRGMDVGRIRKKAVEKKLMDPADASLSEKDILQFIFEPGFSTADKTTMVSGRGVGLDVVKKNIARLKGLISVHSKPGQGTRISLRLPLTLAIVPTLVVGVREETFGVPLASVIESIRIAAPDIREVNGREMISLRDTVLPLARLDELFELDKKPSRGGAAAAPVAGKRKKRRGSIFVVVVGLAEKRLGIIVDELKRQQEVVIKNMGTTLKNAPGISGATIMGDGRVALILDVGQIIEEAAKRERPRRPVEPAPQDAGGRR